MLFASGLAATAARAGGELTGWTTSACAARRRSAPSWRLADDGVVLAAAVAVDVPTLPLRRHDGLGRPAVPALRFPGGVVSDRRGANPAPAPRVDGAVGLHSRLPNDQRSASRRRPQAGTTLELVDETTDQEIDVDALHDALAVLLVRYHRRSGERVGAYYVCGGAVASGPSVCTAPKIATSYLEDAVVDGIQKRLDHVVNAKELRRRLLPVFARPNADLAPEIENRLGMTSRKIGRLVDALMSGTDELPSVRGALVELERERTLLEEQLAAARQRRAGGPVAVVTDMIEQLIDGLSDARRVLATGEPEERKALVRVFLGGIRIEAAAGRAVLRWFRVPQAPPVKLVAVGGIEPPTRGL